MSDNKFKPLNKKQEAIANRVSGNIMQYFNQMNWTPEQIARKAYIEASNVASQIGSNGQEDYEDDEFNLNYEDIIQMKAPTNYGFLYKWWKVVRNNALWWSESCCILVGEEERSNFFNKNKPNNVHTQDEQQVENKQVETEPNEITQQLKKNNLEIDKESGNIGDINGKNSDTSTTLAKNIAQLHN